MVVQCRLAETSESDTSAAAKKLRATEKKLAKALEQQAAHMLAERLGYPKDFVGALQLRVDIERGFVTAIQAPADVLLRLDAAFEAAPLLCELRLAGIPPYDRMTELDASYFESPLLARLSRLSLGTLGNANELSKIIARTPHLSNLRAFTFNGTTHSAVNGPQHILTAQGISALAASPHLTRLAHLTFEYDLLGDDGVRVIADGPWKLESLSVPFNATTGASFEALARAPNLAGLERLVLSHSLDVRPDQIAALVSSRHLSSLRSLDIEQCELGLPGLAAMLDALALPALEELIAASNGFGEKGAELIASSTKLSKLKTLDITKNQFNKKGIVALASGPGLAGIGKVLLNERDSADARKALLESKTLASTIVYFRGKRVAKAS